MQSHTEMDIDTEQISPNSLRVQLSAYQSTVKDFHDQNEHNAELLGRLEAIVTEKDAELSHLRTKEIQKDLMFQAQQRDFKIRLAAEQNAREQVGNTLEGLRQELETLKEAQNGPNPMDVSSTTDANNELLREKQKAEEEKRIFEETLAKTETEYEQALANKNCEINSEIEHIRKNMEDQIRREREQAAKASENQLKTIMLELHALM